MSRNNKRPPKHKATLHAERFGDGKTYCGRDVDKFDPKQDRYGSLMACISTPPKRFNLCRECFSC